MKHPETDPVSFTIEAVHAGPAVDGRNCDSDLSRGFEFREVVELVFVRKEMPEGGYAVIAEDRARYPISCRVIGIEAYRREFSTLSSGMTARLTLAGTSLDELLKFVSGRKAGTVFVLRG